MRRRPISSALVAALLAFAVMPVFTVSGQSTAYGDSAAREFALPGEAVFPEGVAYDEATGDFYVGSTSDGTIFRGNVETGEVEVFSEGGADGRTTAIGMEVDDQGRLFVAGGATGQVFVYDTADATLLLRAGGGLDEETFLNDVAVSPSGDVYVTDSLQPMLLVIRASMLDTGDITPGVDAFLDVAFLFIGTELAYEEGVNANGIVTAGDGEYLIIVQSNTGKLFRIDFTGLAVAEIDLGGETVTGGDGLLLDGQTLYVVRNFAGLIVPVELSDDFSSGIVGEGFTDPSFAFPTTIAQYDGCLLVVNSQFDRRDSGPELPFTVSAVPIPDANTMAPPTPHDC